MLAGRVCIPPIKIQGIKSKLIPLIRNNVYLGKDTCWIEPFMGSGVVGFNVAPQKAVFCDTNPHIISFYDQLRAKTITSYDVRNYLEYEGDLLAKHGEDHYYYIRDRFNDRHDVLDFLFLNRAGFNGMIRFNKKYEYNVPFGHKPQRFSRAYVTKIVNQVRHLEHAFSDNDWVFLCQSFEESIKMANSNSFVYCDPPYIGRHVDYYDSWDVDCERLLRDCLLESGSKFMLSTWDYNLYRKNEYIDQLWHMCYKINQEHFYFVGAKEINRTPMMEALLVNYLPTGTTNSIQKEPCQLSIFEVV